MAVADARQSVAVAVTRPNCDGRGTVVADVDVPRPSRVTTAASPRIFAAVKVCYAFGADATRYCVTW